MGMFLATLIAVAILLLIALPGYIFIKKRILSVDCIPGFSKVLLFVCQPALVIYTFNDAEFSVEMLKNLGLFMLGAVLIHALMLSLSCLLLHKKFGEVFPRIATVATTFANSSFFGIPIIEAVMGKTEAKELIIYTTAYAMIMNLVGWTVGSAVISKSKKYISAKKLFINPCMLGVVIGLPFLIFSFTLPKELDTLMSMITVLGKMTSPLSMLIIGMRLATAELKEVFCRLKIYLTAIVKLVAMPLFAFLIIYLFPIPTEVKQTFYIICACPTASIVLNFSELIGQGQKEAAATVLLSTVLSIVALPFMMLMLPLF